MNALTKAQQAGVAAAAAAQISPLVAPEEEQQYLIFTLVGEAFGVAILCIKEIIEYGQVTAVPMMPAFLRGVINLRGAVVPVVDLAARFGRECTPVSRRTCIVIIEIEMEHEQHVVGVIVDAVNEVIEIPRANIEPPPAFGVRIRTDFIEGMGKVDGKFVIILNVAQVLSFEEMSLLAAAGKQGEVLAAEGT